MNKFLASAATLLILAGITLAGCSTQKKAIATPGATTTEERAIGYDAVKASYGNWNRVRVPFTLRLNAPQKASISGTATMERGRLLLLSMRVLGIEMAVVQVTPDSATFVDKMNRRYLSLPVDKALGGFDANLSNIQDLLTGRAFLLGTDSLAATRQSDFNISVIDAGRAWTLTPRRTPKEAAYSFTFNPANELTGLTVTPKGHPEATLGYSDTAGTPEGIFASLLSIDLTVKDKRIDATLEWNWNRARYDNDVDATPVKISGNYKPINPEALIKSLPVNAN